MATVTKFEDLIVWQRARELAAYIYKLTRKADFSRDRGLKDQIQRASVSVMSNIAEGFERGTNLELLNYLFIAKGSAGEVRAQLYVALDLVYITKEEFERGLNMAQGVSSLIYKFIQSIKGSTFRGLQHKHARKKSSIDEYMEKGGYVFTPRGVMTKKEAEEKGLDYWN